MRTRRFLPLCAVAIVIAAALTACSSSSKQSASNGTGGSSGSGGASAAGTIKVGVLADLTGPASASFATVEKGVSAYFDAVNAAGGVNGQKISYVMADTTSTTAGTLAAAQKLVETDKVFAILSINSEFFAAAPYTLKAGVPVIGAGIDGQEWNNKANTNLFTVQGAADPGTPYSYMGQLMKSLGTTNCGSIGYSASPASVKAVGAFIASCKAAGLKGSYTQEITFGSTDTSPIALGMKSAGTDGIYLATDPNTGFSLAAALRQNSVPIKAFVSATGYGEDLLESSAAVTAAQGFYFSSEGQPIEQNTAATQKEVADFAKVGVNTLPTDGQQYAYLISSGFVAGLKAAGPNPSQASYIKALRGVSDFDADGLLAPMKVNFNDYDPANSCIWVVRLEGKQFTPIKGSPFCGGKLSS